MSTVPSANTVFAANYADAYDTLYHDKDYERECDLLEHALAEHATRPVRTVLDLGCGTGNHALPLAERGYRVTGVDLSGEMLERAAEKGRQRRLDVRWLQGDVRHAATQEKFDAALLMFAVLGYQQSNADVAATLAATRRQLVDGGLLVFDVWHGPAVLRERPGERVKVVPTPDGELIRAASSELDVRRHLCRVRYRLWRCGATGVEATDEEHTMRYFFPQELALFLEHAGLELLRLATFGDWTREPGETDWNVMGVARAG